MKTYDEILNKILELEERLEEKRINIKIAGGQNTDMCNEPLFNQSKILRWVLEI